MNPRIKELADQCWVSYSYEHAISSEKYKTVESSEFNKEKFAELIVKECMSLCEDLKFQHRSYRMEETDFGMKNIYAEGEATCDLLQYKMKKHFGVEP